MTPQKRQKANVKKILDNPVQSKAQEILRPKKEGFFGWLSYLGWSLWCVFPLVLFVPTEIDTFLSEYEVWNTLLDNYPLFILSSFGIGFALTLITMIRNKHLHSKWILFVLFALTVIGNSIMLMTIDSPLFMAIIITVIIFWIYSLCWYPYYFYKKSKEGYRYVWLKVLLFTFLPFLSFIGAEVEDRTVGPMMGDTITISESEYDRYKYY